MTGTCRGAAMDRHRLAESLEDPHKMWGGGGERKKAKASIFLAHYCIPE